MADSIALGLRLGTATEHANFAGIEGEITINETDHRAVVHDGVTKGGYPMAKKSEVDGAIQTANSASSTASAAQTAANEAKNTASSAVTTANGAVTTANTAKTTAEGAVKTANTASTNASSAKTSAESAVSTANTAKTTAEGAVSTANTAKSTADTAKSTADSALAKANKAVQKVNGVAPGTDGNVEIEIPSSVHVGTSAPTDADTSVWIDTDENNADEVVSNDDILEAANRVTDVEVNPSVATVEALQTAIARVESNLDTKLDAGSVIPDYSAGVNIPITLNTWGNYTAPDDGVISVDVDGYTGTKTQLQINGIQMFAIGAGTGYINNATGQYIVKKDDDVKYYVNYNDTTHSSFTMVFYPFGR